MTSDVNDIETLDDCAALVNAFYESARRDPLLGPVFELRIAGHWPEHLARMTSFWATVLFAVPRYQGKPFERHVGLPIGPAHFARWTSLWSAEVDRRFAGPRAEHAKQAAQRMAQRLGAALAPASLST